MGGVTGSRVDAFLAHYGVKGMRWGVRRSDAELRKSRKEKKASAKEEAKSEKPKTNRSVTKERKETRKKIRTLSDGDLDAFVKRLDTEKKAKTLADGDLSPGRAAVKAIMSDTGKKAIVGVAAFVTVAAVKKKMGEKSEVAEYIERAVKPKKK